jgi:hypothetical protein
MGTTDPEERAVRTFAEASILGSRLVEGMESRPPTVIIFSALPIFLSRNRLMRVCNCLPCQFIFVYYSLCFQRKFANPPLPILQFRVI